MSPVVLQSGIVREVLVGFLDQLIAALPAILSGLVFLAFAGILVQVIRFVLHQVLRRTIPEESDIYRQFVETLVAVVLWFGVLLAFLSVVGLEQIAAALGTATGFLALGVSYALSGMLADVVAGVYLLRDPDFMPGDTVAVGDMTGEVEAIELRKTRFTVEEDVVVRANAEIEKRWTKKQSGA